MRRPSPLTRRKFLEAAAAAAAAAPLASCGGGSGGESWAFFTAPEAKTLQAVCDRIVPPDQDPGAAWAGAARYIDRQLTGPFRDYSRDYRLGLSAVDRSSAILFGKPFAELTGEEGDRLLAAMEKGEAPAEAWKAVPQKTFFNLIVDHTLQGFYGDPRHGGNREGVAWKMLGISPSPVRGRRHEPRWKGGA
jgi:gluconate 2-dehydrogenase gamma chain